jgi:soluble lytic murein transglycosylase-like protein
MSGFRQNYAGHPELMIDAMHRYFGLGYSQAMTLEGLEPAQLGTLARSLEAAGIDPKNMSANGISAMAQIVGGDRGTLNTQARALWSRLSTGDAKKLTDASNGGDEALRKALLQLTAKYGQEETEGDKTRKSINDMSKSLTDQAEKLLGATNTIRDTLMLAFGKRGDQMMTADDIHKAVIQGQKDTVNRQADARISKARAAFNLASGVDEYGRPYDPKGMQQAYENLQKETAAANKDRADALARIDAGESPPTAAGAVNTLPIPDSLKGGGATPSTRAGAGSLARDGKTIAYLAETDRVAHLTPGTSYAQIMQESSFDPNAVSKKGAIGLAQVMPKTLASLEKRVGRKLDPRNRDDALLMHRMLMVENMQHFGNERDALTAYNAGWDRSVWGTNSESASYAPSIMGQAPVYSFMTPENAPAPNPNSKQSFSFEHSITLQNQNGTPVAPPVTVSKQVGPPQPAGTQR